MGGISGQLTALTRNFVLFSRPGRSFTFKNTDNVNNLVQHFGFYNFQKQQIGGGGGGILKKQTQGRRKWEGWMEEERKHTGSGEGTCQGACREVRFPRARR